MYVYLMYQIVFVIKNSENISKVNICKTINIKNKQKNYKIKYSEII